YFALCPFHAEKSPSFSVNEDLQIYKCFGCGAAGDVFSFVEKAEHLTFPEILEKLSQKAGIDIKKVVIDPKYKHLRDTAFKLNNILEKVYISLLNKSKTGIAARAYLKRRAVKP